MMLTYKIERFVSEQSKPRWAVVGRDAKGNARDHRFYPTQEAAKAALAARQEEQAEGVASDAAIRAGLA